MNFRRWFRFIVGVFLLSMAAPAKAWIVWPTQDTVISEVYPFNNYCGDDTANRISYFSDGKRERTLIGGIDVPVSHADRDTLHIRATSGAKVGTYSVTAYLITSSWSECTVDWSSQPSYDANVKGEYTGSLDLYWGIDGWWHAIPISSIVAAWTTGGRPKYGIMLEVTPIDYPGGSVTVTFHNKSQEFPPNVTYGGSVLAPNACFTANPRSGEAPLTVSFTNCTQNAYLYNWEFGDGGQYVGQYPPPHTYTSAGTYSVWLTAQNHDESDRVKDSICVGPGCPGAEPICSVSPLTLPFGEVYIGDCSSKSFTITNTGGGTLSGTVSEPCSRFAITSPNPPNYSLGAGQSQTFTVEFCPDVEMSYQCTIETGTNCDDNDNVVASGTGRKGPTQYVHPYKIDVESVAINYTSYDPARLPMGVTIGAPVSVDCIVKDATGKPIPGSEPGTDVIVFDFLWPEPICPAPISPDANGRFSYSTGIGPSVNGNFRSLFARLEGFDDLPFLMGLNVKLEDSANLVSEASLNALYWELLTDAPPGYYTSIGFQGLTAVDERGQPLYEWTSNHRSEAIEPREWSDLVTQNSFPFVMQIATWYDGITQQDAFGPHLEVTDEAAIEEKEEREIAFNLSPALLVKPLIALGGVRGLCLNPYAWARSPQGTAIGCGVAVNSVVSLLITDVTLAINRVSGLVDPAWEWRENRIREAGEADRLSNYMSLETIPIGVIGDGIEAFEESLRKYSIKISLDVLKAGEEAEESGNYPFVVTAVDSVNNGLGFDYRYSFIYGGQGFTMKVVDPSPIAIEGESPTVPPLSTALEIAPNPFNPETQIAFTVETEGLCSVNVYDVAGRKVKTILESTLSTGTYTVTWDGTDASGRACASGMYTVSLESAGTSIQRRAVMLK